MAMAEVAAANPSHTSATGSNVPAVARSTSSKSPPTIFSPSPSATPRANPHPQGPSPHHQHSQQQQQQQQQQHQIQNQQQQQQQHQQQQQQQPPHLHHHHQQSQQPLPQPLPAPSSYTPSSPPIAGDGNISSNFPQHWTQPSHMQYDRSVSRGLPPIMSPMMVPSGSHASSAHDNRQPVSPRTVPLGLSDTAQESAAQVPDLPTPRKRSKVSRACDECRRKKIRCDATSESGIEQCSSCKRVGSKCSFSRVPMKRGPSKGILQTD
ncbi:hypothetical protein DFH27DRAFT_316879 [Peziza echinospora]|nr:hypothetical protein DFH27DRAFT_316879 [Peziza echinospora]